MTFKFLFLSSQYSLPKYRVSEALPACAVAKFKHLSCFSLVRVLDRNYNLKASDTADDFPSHCFWFWWQKREEKCVVSLHACIVHLFFKLQYHITTFILTIDQTHRELSPNPVIPISFLKHFIKLFYFSLTKKQLHRWPLSKLPYFTDMISQNKQQFTIES